MTKEKPEKTKQDRLKEGIYLLKQLRDAGIKEYVPSFKDLQQQITVWVKTGEPWTGIIPFQEYQRVAHVDLPKYDNKIAGIDFKTVKHR